MDEVRQNLIIDELKPTHQDFKTVVQILACLVFDDGVTENVKRLADITSGF